MIRRFAIAAVVIASVLAVASLAGCSRTYHIQIQSNTCWSGQVNNDTSISDCGDSNYKVVGTLGCVRLQKQTVEGYLRVRIDGGPWAETTDVRGIVQVCR